MTNRREPTIIIASTAPNLPSVTRARAPALVKRQADSGAPTTVGAEPGRFGAPVNRRPRAPPSALLRWVFFANQNGRIVAAAESQLPYTLPPFKIIEAFGEKGGVRKMGTLFRAQICPRSTRFCVELCARAWGTFARRSCIAS